AYNPFVIVERDQEVGWIIPPTTGHPGRDVFGQPLPPLPGREAELPELENIVVDGNVLRAGIYGQLDVSPARVKVCPLLVIDNDVDLKSGNIHFRGSIYVKGNVQPGFRVEAEDNVQIDGASVPPGPEPDPRLRQATPDNVGFKGDLQIDGAVVGATIRGNNIFIKQGINGHGGGQIIARGNLCARYLENARVLAGGSVEIHDAILFSVVHADGDVVVTRGHGLIAGGVAMAGRKIIAKQFGLPATTTTSLLAGIPPRLRCEFTSLTSRLNKIKREIPRARSTLDWLKNRKEEYTLVLRLTRKIFRWEWEKQKIEEQLAKIERELAGRHTEDLSRSEVRAYKICYGGVRVSIGWASRFVGTHIKNAVFIHKNGEVRIGADR
ncbi:MAG: FapA family protein, partial [Negativicutes bacterium]|nr:FapA family protein [Negativicutes bacterium]